MGARVIPHPITGFVEAARQFAIEQTTGDWVVMLDADEQTPRSLAERLRQVADEDAVDVVMIPRVNIVLGRWSKVSAKNWPNRHPRFFRRTPCASASGSTRAWASRSPLDDWPWMRRPRWPSGISPTRASTT